MYADLSLDHRILKDIALKPCERKELAQEVVKDQGLSISRACLLVSLGRSMWYYRTTRDDSQVMDRPTEMGETKPNRGFIIITTESRSQGFIWNRKHVLGIYRIMGATQKEKQKTTACKGKDPFGTTNGTLTGAECRLYER